MLRPLIFALCLLGSIISPIIAQSESLPTVLRVDDKLELGEYLLIGEAELIELPELGILWRGRIDSGATSTSLHAVNVEEFERDGKPWVRFSARNEALDTQVDMEKPVVRIAEIKGRAGSEGHRRPVIETTVVIGGVARTIEVNLADRTTFEFPVLIGRNYLSGIMLIDVGQSYIHGGPDGER